MKKLRHSSALLNFYENSPTTTKKNGGSFKINFFKGHSCMVNNGCIKNQGSLLSRNIL